LYQIATDDEKWTYYDNLKKSWVGLGQPSTSTPKCNIHGRFCCAFGGI